MSNPDLSRPSMRLRAESQKPLIVSIMDAAALLSSKPGLLNELIERGQLEAIKLGLRRVRPVGTLMLHRADHGDDVGLDHAVDLGDLVQQHLVAVVESLQSSCATSFSSDKTTTLANLQFCICIAFSVSTVVMALAVCSSSINR